MRTLSAAKGATTTVVLCGRNQKQIKRKAISRSKGWAVRLANLRLSYSSLVGCVFGRRLFERSQLIERVNCAGE